MPVTSTSTRFIDTVTQPRSGTEKPIARSAGKPPHEVRTDRAMSFAAASSLAGEIQVERDQRLARAHRRGAGGAEDVRTEVGQPLPPARRRP